MYNRLSEGGTGRVAQLGEHLLCKQGVRGSNPLTSTNLIPALITSYATFSAALFWCNFGTFGTIDRFGVCGRSNPYPTR